MQFFLTIVSNPDKFLIDDSFLKEVETFALKENITLRLEKTLSKSEAYDYSFTSDITNAFDFKEKLLELFNSFAVDFFILEKNLRSIKKLLVIDMDSTLIENECIDEIAIESGKYEQVKNITSQAMSGNEIFESSLEQRVKLLKDVSVKSLEKILKEKITPSKNSETLIKTMSKFGSYTILASGGFTFFTSFFKEKYGFDQHFSNRLVVKNGFLTGEVEKPIYGSNDKLDTLNEYAHKLNIQKNDIIAIGDGANDLPMLTSIPFGVSYKAKEIVSQNTNFHINKTSLASALFIQGIERKDFVTKF